MVAELIVGPGLFALGAFFVMLPYVAVRIFGVILIGFSAMSGMLDPEVLQVQDYMTFGAVLLLALGVGALLNRRLTDTAVDRVTGKDPEASREVLVPYAQDGSWFHPGVKYADGRYHVGQKGEEKAIRSYHDALGLLRDMPVACWRRPSPRSGLFGIVSATRWAPPPENLERGRQRRTRAAARGS